MIRFRVIYRQQEADPYKDSTMRLRDAAITREDYELWKSHEAESLDDPSAISWPGSEGLVEKGLYLVTDNAQTGRINGQRLADAAPLWSMPPVSDSATGVVVRCEAVHNNPRGVRRKAADFRNLHKGAAQFENVNRRLEQVGKVLWRKRFGPHPPDSLGGFDGHTGLFDLGSIPPGFKVFLCFDIFTYVPSYVSHVRYLVIA